jgi:protein TonB
MISRVLVAAAVLAGPSLLAQQPAPRPSAQNDVYFEFQVEKRVAALPGNPAPRYPDVLRAAQVEGQVLSQFVVDTAGRADTATFKVIKSAHDLFTMAVKRNLPLMEFSPAEVNGRKVKQLVQMSFMFSSTPATPPPPPSRHR